MLNMAQAKKFFCDYNGFKFHMSREEPGMIMEYDKLNVPRETEEKWRQEILDKLESKFYTRYNAQENTCWGCFWDFLKVLENTDTECKINGKRLLKMLDVAKQLDPMQKILIMELIPNVISWICLKTDLKEHLAPLINKLINFDVSFTLDEDGWRDPQARRDKALRHIDRSAVKYHIQVKEAIL